MGFFNRLFKDKQNTEIIANQHGGCIKFNIDGQQSKRFDDYVAWKNNTILLGGTQEVGSFSYDVEGNLTVFSDVGTEIGKINIKSRLITLENLYAWQKWHERLPTHCRELSSDEYIMTATYNNDFIRDYQDKSLVAKIEGNPDIAAAAFICAVYEEREESKYHHFYTCWKI